MTRSDPRTDQDAQRAAQRAALDHVLALTVRTSWADALVLRGSMAMLAWADARAREPADLDWVAAPGPVPVHPLSPYPYVDDLDAVRYWPEASHGAAEYELFKDEAESFATGGLHPRTPPEGTRWIRPPETDDRDDLVRELVGLLDASPDTPGGHPADLPGGSPTSRPPAVRFDPRRYRIDPDWEYTEYVVSTERGGGVRVSLPWTGEHGTSGDVQVDIVFDEPMEESPVHALIPRADGREPTLVRAASRELSLAWKLLWLHRDIARHGQGRGKDLYDAVVLAESPRTRLRPPLLRRVLRAQGEVGVGDVTLERISAWDVDWAGFRADQPQVRGDLDSWLGRLDRAVRRMLETDGGEPGPARDGRGAC
ncbi:nucleotidyl transferase AbiEii/AbiGii toxin family protein [Yinghuangia sp. ASG 101]|uniref:nucleotidyl transferase AbiEii/AbiGii toxin family protein n=1 Tax=Yinghuangia sp. ASG 101 TaxID=2896848 RepID=UPI001E3659D8|nr:nucleotidyl transferase AbiEii/AbiGii toxin family protein [Yinghuangia sp. ASG 101]UGQ11632.1 nucleotidyl transferase AbiEii/AbiGii toxin family protein [Yinghuangia sp. ASG 101]